MSVSLILIEILFWIRYWINVNRATSLISFIKFFKKYEEEEAISKLKKDLENTMSKALDTLVRNIAKIRAGRPNPSLLDDIEADYFDTKTPIKQLANISVSDASTLTLNVWDKSAIAPIEKAIMESL